MRIVCWQMILTKYSLFPLNISKNVTNLSSAAVVIGPLRVKDQSMDTARYVWWGEVGGV